MKLAQVIALDPENRFAKGLTDWIPFDAAVQLFKQLNGNPAPEGFPEKFTNLAITTVDGGRSKKGRFAPAISAPEPEVVLSEEELQAAADKAAEEAKAAEEPKAKAAEEAKAKAEPPAKPAKGGKGSK